MSYSQAAFTWPIPVLQAVEQTTKKSIYSIQIYLFLYEVQWIF